MKFPGSDEFDYVWVTVNYDDYQPELFLFRVAKGEGSTFWSRLRKIAAEYIAEGHYETHTDCGAGEFLFWDDVLIDIPVEFFAERGVEWIVIPPTEYMIELNSSMEVASLNEQASS